MASAAARMASSLALRKSVSVLSRSKTTAWIARSAMENPPLPGLPCHSAGDWTADINCWTGRCQGAPAGSPDRRTPVHGPDARLAPAPLAHLAGADDCCVFILLVLAGNYLAQTPGLRPEPTTSSCRCWPAACSAWSCPAGCSPAAAARTLRRDFHLDRHDAGTLAAGVVAAAAALLPTSVLAGALGPHPPGGPAVARVVPGPPAVVGPGHRPGRGVRGAGRAAGRGTALSRPASTGSRGAPGAPGRRRWCRPWSSA